VVGGLVDGDEAQCGEHNAWEALAACAGPSVDPGIFYVERGEDLEPARQVCRCCPVQLCCAIDAVMRGDDHGLWGNLSGRQRRRARSAYLKGTPILVAISTVRERGRSCGDTGAQQSFDMVVDDFTTQG
jgi:hypothetical protein